jgi:demethoxyubiquinone hydroxylase (CLK1/Coq7/Cat5 family)
MVEVLILGTATFIAGMAISIACKNSKEPTINNHYGDVNNNTNSNNVMNSHNTTTDSHTDNRNHINETNEKILQEIARLLEDKDKARELEEVLKANENLINKYKK